MLRSVLFVLIGVGLGLMWKYYSTPTSSPLSSQSSSKPAIVAPGFSPHFSLINHHGEAVTEEYYKDKYQLVYFGFTFCPDICPTELQKMANVLKQVGDRSSQIYPLFISVDPERDTPDVLKSYLSHFGETFIGLTGTEDQIDQAMDSFKVYAAKTEDPEYTNYMMSHSSYLYFLNGSGDLLGIYSKDDSIEKIIEDVKATISSKASISVPIQD